MPDREREDLERELRELGFLIDYPPTPDVTRTVRRRLDAEGARHWRRGRLRARAVPGWVVAAAATVLLCLTLLSPAVRSTVSDSASMGASGGAGGAAGGAAASRATSAEHATETPPSSGGAAAGSAAGANLGLNGKISPPEARARVGEILLPRTPPLAGGPYGIYRAGPSEKDGVVLTYAPQSGLPPLAGTEVGLLLVEVSGDLDSAYPAIDRASRPEPEEVLVGGDRGLWFPDGRSLRLQPGEAENLPGGALLWQRGDVALLMRADVSREEAIQIAETVD